MTPRGRMRMKDGIEITPAAKIAIRYHPVRLFLERPGLDPDSICRAIQGSSAAPPWRRLSQKIQAICDAVHRYRPQSAPLGGE
jgi:hypothetical protein